MDIQKCIDNSLKEKSKLNGNILSIDGMSSRFNRHLLNNIGAEFESFNYLEVGVHKGSTYISSLYENNIINAWGIDDWSQFGDQSVIFLDNCRKFNVPTKFIGLNCFNIDSNAIRNIDFYFYDGNHYAYETKRGLIHFYNSFSDEFLYVIDDYDWAEIQEGTREAINSCNFKIRYENYLKSGVMNNSDGWWNGLGIFILQK
jgi:hypothetical protein